MKAVTGSRPHRSALYHLIHTIIPIDHALKARLDAVGAITVVVLLMGTVCLVRLILGWMH